MGGGDSQEGSGSAVRTPPPPGTGKTFVARHLTGGSDGFMELVQFHPAYAYEDFMQGIRPRTTSTGGVEYRVCSQ